MHWSGGKIIIVGQGISGTFLSWFCHRAGLDFLVIDKESNNAPSRVAAGIINPVTGRRVVKVWMDNLVIPFAEAAYGTIGDFLQLKAITKTRIIDFFPNPFMKESFLKKLSQKEDYIDLLEDGSSFDRYFNYEFGIGTIAPAYIVNMAGLLPAWRQFLKNEGKLLEETLDFASLKITDEKVSYKELNAEKIIFCDGTAGASNPYFSLLPFALNKGEALIIEAPDLPAASLYKKSMLLAPLTNEQVFWAGTNYTWDFNDDQPTAAFRTFAAQTLKNWLKIPFKIVDHKAAIRPATVERRPFAGFHPVYKNVGLLNGMGTKGCSLAPYFASQLVNHLLGTASLQPEVTIGRYQRILSRLPTPDQ